MEHLHSGSVGANCSKRKLIIHAGICKTGTTALQHYLDRNRRQFNEIGILYPKEGVSETREPKHQWIVNALISADKQAFRQRMALVEAEIQPTTHTVILSTEGISNHWWDFSEQSKALLHDLRATFNVSLWVWLREPATFFASYYLQAMRNPVVQGVPAYGRDQTAAELLEMPWVAKHLEYGVLLKDLNDLFGEDSVFAFSYTDDIIGAVCRLLNAPRHSSSDSRENTTVMRSAGLSFLKIINRYKLNSREKEQAYQLAAELNALIGSRSEPFTLTAEETVRVREICGYSQQELEDIGRRSLERWSEKHMIKQADANGQLADPHQLDEPC